MYHEKWSPHGYHDSKVVYSWMLIDQLGSCFETILLCIPLAIFHIISRSKLWYIVAPKGFSVSKTMDPPAGLTMQGGYNGTNTNSGHSNIAITDFTKVVFLEPFSLTPMQNPTNKENPTVSCLFPAAHVVALCERPCIIYSKLNQL